MAVNKAVGGNARKSAVRKRSQLKTSVESELHWTKRLMDKSATANPIQGCSVRVETQLN
jgi:hypothetical protein